jgi:hypothetical protein
MSGKREAAFWDLRFAGCRRLPKAGTNGSRTPYCTQAPYPLKPTRIVGTAAATGRHVPRQPEDMREVLAAGVSPQQVEDTLAVCAAFNTTDRLADAFGFEVLSPEGFEAGAKYLLKRGYR